MTTKPTPASQPCRNVLMRIGYKGVPKSCQRCGDAEECPMGHAKSVRDTPASQLSPAPEKRIPMIESDNLVTIRARLIAAARAGEAITLSGRSACALYVAMDTGKPMPADDVAEQPSPARSDTQNAQHWPHGATEVACSSCGLTMGESRLLADLKRGEVKIVPARSDKDAERYSTKVGEDGEYLLFRGITLVGEIKFYADADRIVRALAGEARAERGSVGDRIHCRLNGGDCDCTKAMTNRCANGIAPEQAERAPSGEQFSRVGQCVAVGSDRIIIASANTVEWADRIVAALARRATAGTEERDAFMRTCESLGIAATACSHIDAARLMAELKEFRATAGTTAPDLGALGEQSDAWFAVTEALNEAAPGWQANERTGMKAAVSAIKKLAGNAAPTELPEPGHIGHLGTKFYSERQVRALLASNTATTAPGDLPEPALVGHLGTNYYTESQVREVLASNAGAMLPVGTLAWALIAPSGNIRTWSYSRANVDKVHSLAPECTVAPIIGARPVDIAPSINPPVGAKEKE